MIKKVLFVIFAMFLSYGAYAAEADHGQIINIRYIHELVKQEHGVELQYGDDPNKAANMKYLLTIVDMVNAHFNGDGWTNYGDDPEYATRQAANTVAGIYCIRNLIEHYYFTATTTPDTTSFSFQISANGVYHIDWGDGTREHYDKSNSSRKPCSHTYETAGEYTIRLGGYSRGYNVSSVISFAGNTNVATVDGSLGKIFSTLKDPKDPTKPMQPAFSTLFQGCTNLTNIPATLFSGIHGQPVYYMFHDAFALCSSLTEVPADLFARISGTPAVGLYRGTFRSCVGLTEISSGFFGNIYGQPAEYMFGDTFSGCYGLREIPDDLFAKISGTPAPSMFTGTFLGCVNLNVNLSNYFFGDLKNAPAPHMFSSTFRDCSSLTGTIPNKLFGDISGPAATRMFYYTFYRCSNLTGVIPDKLFGDFSGYDGAPYAFHSTFRDCYKLNGVIPDNLFTGIKVNVNCTSMFESTFEQCIELTGFSGGVFSTITGNFAPAIFLATFRGCTGLTGSIPSVFFGNIYGAPQPNMFAYTFARCSGLTGAIPDGLFSNIYGTPAQSMFAQTFFGCSGLSGAIPENLFGDISGAPAAGMFQQTFYGCAKLGTGITDADKPEYMLRGYAIPETLFGRITENSNAAGSMFYATFFNCSGLTGAIPPLLFGGINGLTNGTASWMFSHTFYNCSGLTGEIPFGLFGDMTGAPQERMFEATFQGCSGLTKIPEYLFGHISGPGALCAYRWVFAGCRNLEGAIPDYLFAGVYGAGTYTFSMVFRDCAKLTSIPEHLFGAVTGFSFDEAFYGCVGLTGPSAKVYVESEGAYKYLYEVWPDVNYGVVYYMDTKLEDYGAWE